MVKIIAQIQNKLHTIQISTIEKFLNFLNFKLNIFLIFKF